MWRRALLLAVVLLAGAPVAACEGDPAPPDRGFVDADIAALVEKVRTFHPDPWHGVDEPTFVAAAHRPRPAGRRSRPGRAARRGDAPASPC